MQQLLTFQGLVEKDMHELTQPLLMVLDFLLLVFFLLIQAEHYSKYSSTLLNLNY